MNINHKDGSINDEQVSKSSNHDKEIAQKIRVFIQSTYDPDGDYNEAEFIISKINEMEIEAIQRNVEIERLGVKYGDIDDEMILRKH